jgi:hypothetical protein
MRGPCAEARGEQTLPRIDHPADQDQAGARSQGRDDGEQTLLGGIGQRFSATDHESLRATEQQRRGEVVERLLEAFQAVVGPQGAGVVGAAVGREPAAQDGERALDEKRLLAVEEVVLRERCGRERPERARRAAQKPSIDCW